MLLQGSLRENEYKIVDLEEKADVYPSTLSGGQKQRVALLRWGWHKYRAKQVTSAAKDEAVEAAGVEPVESFSVTADEGIGRTSQAKPADMTLGERLAAEQKQRIEPVLGDSMGAGSSKDV